MAGDTWDFRIHEFRSEEFFRPNWCVSVHLSEHTPDEYPPEHKYLNQRQFWKIMYVSGGRGAMVINHRRYALSPGFVGLIHPSDLTTLELEEKVVIYNILFQRAFIERELETQSHRADFFSIFWHGADNLDPIRHDVLHLIDATRDIGAIVRKMQREYEADELFAQELLKTHLLELLYLLARQSFYSSIKKRKFFAVDYIKSTLKKNFTDPPDIDELMEKTGLSSNVLFSLYRTTTGETMGQTIRRHKLAYALDMLKNTDLPIAKICSLAGFPDVSNFYRLFRKTTGRSPGFYRNRN